MPCRAVRVTRVFALYRVRAFELTGDLLRTPLQTLFPLYPLTQRRVERELTRLDSRAALRGLKPAGQNVPRDTLGGRRFDELPD